MILSRRRAFPALLLVVRGANDGTEVVDRSTPRIPLAVCGDVAEINDVWRMAAESVL